MERDGREVCKWEEGPQRWWKVMGHSTARLGRLGGPKGLAKGAVTICSQPTRGDNPCTTGREGCTHTHSDR